MIACISTSLFSGIATLVVGLAVVLIAWQQWKVSHAKLRLDLFDRRYKIFEATRTLLREITNSATFSDEQLFKFYTDTADAEFLFRSDVVDYLAEIVKRAIDMQANQKRYQALPLGGERSRETQSEHNHLLWFGEQLTSKAITKAFKPYLGFTNIHADFFSYDCSSHQ